MSRFLTARDICERALRAMGKFPVTESAPQGEHLREAMIWLDLILAEVVGTERMFSRIPALLPMLITNGTGTYDLYTTLGTALPADKIEFVVNAWVDDDQGIRYDIEIVNREKFESVARPAISGPPKWLHIDRIDTETTGPTARIFPVPATTDPRTYTLKLEVQRYAPNVAPSGISGTQPQSAVMHDMSQAWQRWMVVQLAHDLGSGPIEKIGEQSLTRFAAMATVAKVRLLAFENREHQTTPPICEPAWWDDDCSAPLMRSSDYGNRWTIR